MGGGAAFLTPHDIATGCVIVTFISVVVFRTSNPSKTERERKGYNGHIHVHLQILTNTYMCTHKYIIIDSFQLI